MSEIEHVELSSFYIRHGKVTLSCLFKHNEHNAGVLHFYKKKIWLTSHRFLKQNRNINLK